MNERLKKLAEQAGEESGFSGYNGFYNEKFAELIVAECTWQLEYAKQGDSFTGETYDNEVNDLLTKQINNLKEHFGI